MLKNRLDNTQLRSTWPFSDRKMMRNHWMSESGCFRDRPRWLSEGISSSVCALGFQLSPMHLCIASIFRKAMQTCHMSKKGWMATTMGRVGFSNEHLPGSTESPSRSRSGGPRTQATCRPGRAIGSTSMALTLLASHYNTCSTIWAVYKYVYIYIHVLTYVYIYMITYI